MKNLMFGSLTVFILFMIVACESGKSNRDHEKRDSLNNNEYTTCSCPHTVICLQPFDDFTQAEARRLKADLEKHFDEQVGWGYEIKILPNKNLTPDLLNDSKTRYRATKIIRSLMKDAESGTTIIGLTHKDISTTIHGVNDYGIMGLAFRPGMACIVSTYRVRPRNMLWKVAMHEFYHAFCGIPHCTSGDEHCIMQDAKGKNPLRRETRFCEKCKAMMW